MASHRQTQNPGVSTGSATRGRDDGGLPPTAPVNPQIAGPAPADRPSIETKPGGPTFGVATHEDVSLAAYYRWLREGGDAETNWYEAEREIRAQGPGQ